MNQEPPFGGEGGVRSRSRMGASLNMGESLNVDNPWGYGKGRETSLDRNFGAMRADKNISSAATSGEVIDWDKAGRRPMGGG